ncbi:MAG: potassium channel beta subunit family protein [Cryomorphaceae bacterium]|nr:aldo/keto reductase [Flavobacteriales bacterium]
MKYRRLGKSGLQVSELSFGSWITFGNQIEDNTSEDLMKMAYDSGVNFFDNAEAYADGASEKVMGEILKKMGWARDTYIVSSKVFFGAGGKLPTQKGLNRKHVYEACNDALKRLQVDYLDLFFCHRPDKQTPIEETVWSMHTLIQQGKILYWGTSEWSAQEIMEAHMVARQYNLIGPVMEQPQYNMLVRDKVEVEYNQIYKNPGLGTTIWSPLASGVLTGKYLNNQEDKTRLKRTELSWLSDKLLVSETLEKVEQLAGFAAEMGISMPHLAIAWCLKNERVSTVILGASKTEQLKENLRAIEHVDKLTPEVMQKIDEILQNKPKHPTF